MTKAIDLAQPFTVTHDQFRKLCNENDLACAPPETEPEMVWVDIETTGLEVENHVTLEVTSILTDKWGLAIDGFHSYVWDPVSHPRAVNQAPELVHQMHMKSNLWQDLQIARQADVSEILLPDTVSQRFLEFVAKAGLPPKKIPMAGNSVHFDRTFLKDELPAMHDWFHYRNIDMSTLKNLALMHNPRIMKHCPPPREKHRGFPDLCDSINQYKFYLDNFLWIQ